MITRTSDKAIDPVKAHRKKDGTWIDLQLPLYRHLVSWLGIKEPLKLAYVVLPKDTSAVKQLPAEWTAADFESADKAAETVVRHIRQEIFWPPSNPPPEFSEDFAAICQDSRFAAAVAQEIAEEIAKEGGEKEGEDDLNERINRGHPAYRNPRFRPAPARRFSLATASLAWPCGNRWTQYWLRPSPARLRARSSTACWCVWPRPR